MAPAKVRGQDAVAARREHVRAAVDNTRLEGLEISDVGLAMADLYATGQMTADEVIQRIKAHHGIRR